jgi:hypothetical protein
VRTSLADRMAEIRADAAHRHVDFITLRGLAERLGLHGSRLGELRDELQSQRAGEYSAPLWVVRPSETRETTPLRTVPRGGGREVSER